jgi:hypothetical protein
MANLMAGVIVGYMVAAIGPKRVWRMVARSFRK